jgi:hypothetical protein
MAAEVGFVGLILWLAVWAGVVYGILQRMRSQHEGARDERVLALALLASIVGVLLAGLNADSLRFFGYWIALAIAWAYIQAGPMRDGTG